MSLDTLTDQAGTQWGAGPDVQIAGSVIQMDPGGSRMLVFPNAIATQTFVANGT